MCTEFMSETNTHNKELEQQQNPYNAYLPIDTKSFGGPEAPTQQEEPEQEQEQQKELER